MLLKLRLGETQNPASEELWNVTGRELRGGLMNLSSFFVCSACLLALCIGTPCLAQGRESDDKLIEQAQHEYTTGKFAEAERDLLEITKRDPSNIYAQVYLGQALFRQEKYAEAVVPYEKARALETNGSKLSSDQHRILVDQLAMAYGISGDLKKSRALLEKAVRDNPEYPLNYYNLACVNAEEGNKGEVLTNLSHAFQHEDNLLKGEKMPDPRTDSSFQKYVRDEDFIKLMAKLGYK
jgi:tetratricopeptide (TPR) repeat protein